MSLLKKKFAKSQSIAKKKGRITKIEDYGTRLPEDAIKRTRLLDGTEEDDEPGDEETKSDADGPESPSKLKKIGQMIDKKKRGLRSNFIPGVDDKPG